MDFAGRMMFAFLEEDNTQRSLFRIRPLLTDLGAVSREEIDELADEGYIRVVPDKKEQYTFKERMRRLGGACALNLRDYAQDAAKIRPNRNYAPPRGENNRYVVYSDAVRELPEDLLYEVVPDLKAASSLTPRCYLRQGGRIQGPYGRTDGQPLGAALQIAPDSERLFAVTLPSGQERLFYWPAQAPVPASLDAAREDARAPSEPEGSADMPGAGPKGPEELQPAEGGRQLPARRQELFPTPVAVHPRALPAPVVNPLHEVVDRRVRQGRPEASGADASAAPTLHAVENPVERFGQDLETLWNGEETREQAVSRLIGMPGASQLICKIMIGEDGNPLFAAMKHQMQDMEAERLSLLMQVDRAKADLQAFRGEALEHASAQGKAELADLSREALEARKALADLSAQRGELALERDALLRQISGLDPCLPRLAPGAGRDCEPEIAAERVASALERAGFACARNDAWDLLIHCALFPRVRISCPQEADALFAAETFCGALGAAFVRLHRPDQPFVFFPGGDAAAFVLCGGDGPLPEGCTRLIVAGGRGPQRDGPGGGAPDPWPCVRLEPRSGWAMAETLRGEALNARQLNREIASRVYELPQPVLQLLASAEKALALQGIGLPAALRAGALNYLRPAAALLEGGVASAIDYAFRGFILPYALSRGADMEKLKPLMCGLPRSLSLL